MADKVWMISRIVKKKLQEEIKQLKTIVKSNCSKCFDLIDGMVFLENRFIQAMLQII